LEKIPHKGTQITTEEQAALNHFRGTPSRISIERYVVSVRLRHSVVLLGYSKEEIVTMRYISIKKALEMRG